MILFRESLSFDWDGGNKDKNWLKRRVTHEECEEVFFDPHKRLLKAAFHMGAVGAEERHLLIGQTTQQRFLFMVFVFRKDKIRVISARDLNKKKRKWYEKNA